MTDRPTETMKRLDRDFAALFGPVTPPTLPPERINEPQSYGPLQND